MREIEIQPTSTGFDIVPQAESLLPADIDALNNYKQYGYYAAHSRICSVCISSNHMTINLMRAKDYLSYDEIARRIQKPGITPLKLKKHFENHFMVADYHSKILQLQDQSTPESLAIVHKIFEGDLDIFGASQALMEIKGKRLHTIWNRLEFLNAHLEDDSVDDIDKQEFIQLNKASTELEASMKDIIVLLDKKIFPSTKEELATAILQFKLKIYSKIIDIIQLKLIHLQRNPLFADVIDQLRLSLAQELAPIEDEILKSGGILRAEHTI